MKIYVGSDGTVWHTHNSRAGKIVTGLMRPVKALGLCSLKMNNYDVKKRQPSHRIQTWTG